MLTSFFGNSRPINYLVLIVLIVGVLGTYQWVVIRPEVSLAQLGYVLLQWMVLAFIVFLFDFMLRKNTLTKSNTFAVLIFSVFTLSFPELMRYDAILWTQLFLLLAMRRILSLQSPHRTRKKIVDAAIWITIASFFYFWALLFFLVLYVAMLKRPQVHYRMLLMPLVGLAAVVVIATAVQFLFFDSLPWFAHWTPSVDRSFGVYNQISWVLPAGVLLLLLVWAVSYRTIRMAKVPKKELPNYQIIHHWSIVALGAIVLAGQRTGVEILLLAPPVAIGITSYIERIEERWFQELLLVVLLLLPLLLFFF